MKKNIFRHWKLETLWLSLLVAAGLIILPSPHNLYSDVRTQNVRVGFSGEEAVVEVLVKLPQPKTGVVQGQGVVKTQVASSEEDGLRRKLEQYGTVLDMEKIEISRRKENGKEPEFRLLGMTRQSADRKVVWHKLAVKTEKSAEELCQVLAKDGAICEPNYKVKALYVPNDTQYSLQWALPRIKAPEAWDIQTGSSSIKIAIIDSGCDMDHPDLELNINQSLSYDILNNDSDPEDDCVDSHGTHLAGIIAAVGDNAQGVAGLNWKADLLIYKALDAEGEGTIDNLMKAIQRAIDDEADIINMSWGTDENSSALYEALQAAYDSGIVLVAAAGNEKKILYPAKYEEVLAVAGTGKADNDPRWIDEDAESAYGREIDVAAPAEDIYSTLKAVPSEELSYGSLSGTSLSCAFVSGEAALLLAQNNQLLCEEIYSIIKENVDPLTTELGKPIGTGRINLFKAIKAVVDGTFNRPPQAVITANPVEGKAPLEVEFSAEDSTDPDGEIVKYSWDFGDGKKGTGREVTHSYREAGNFNVQLKVKDDKGAIGTATTSIRVKSASGVPADEAWIEGKVEGLEKADRTPLSGASVTAQTLDGEELASTQADSEGKYQLKITKQLLEEKRVEPTDRGYYRISLSAAADGFKSQDKEITIKLAKKNTTNFLLQSEPTGGGGNGNGNGNGNGGGGGGGCGTQWQVGAQAPVNLGNGCGAATVGGSVGGTM